MRLLTVLLLLAVALPAVAQEQEIRSANLPRELEWKLLRMFDGGARRHDGEVTIGRMEVVEGDLAVMRGPLRVAGRVEGDVAMVGGDVIVEPGGSIRGSVTVVGGEVRMADDARIGGTITAYGTSDRRYGDRDRDRGRDRDDDDWNDWWRRDRDWSERGYSRLTLRTGASYNRVEGLPLMFGPVVKTAGPDPLRVEALGIWRSESGGLDTDRMGYQVRAEQFLGGHRRLSIGGSVYSVVDPLERWQVGDLEASLAAVIFHEDYRDHYDRTGWSGFVRFQPVRPLEARIEYRDEDHEAVPAADPWSLFDGSDAWRLQPLVAEGELRSITGSVELDLRDDRRDAESGWYGRVAIERPVGGELLVPSLAQVNGGTGDLPARPFDTDFTTAFVDLRRYSPVGYNSQLNLRLVGAGNLAEGALPPQYQHALGGLGTLPGFETFHGDCGARGVVGTHDESSFFASYGCDRFVLGQVEYRGSLSLDFGFGDPDYDDDDWWDEVAIDLSPTWAVFFDAARGWAYPETGQVDTGTLYDVGVGFLIDEFGIYAALPLNGDVEQDPRFFIRLGRRF